MRYYVFGGSSEVLKVHKRNAIISTTDLLIAVQMYKRYVNSIRYDHIYLIADFESRVNHGTTYIDKDLCADLPFFVIGEWHKDPKRNHKGDIRDDHCIVTIDGIEAHFFDNLKALEHAMRMYDAGSKNVSIDIAYFKEIVNVTGKDQEVKVRREVVDFAKLENKNKSWFFKPGIRSVILTESEWIRDYDVQRRKMYNFVLSEKKNKIDKVVVSV